MIWQRISLTWLLLSTITLIFVLYIIAAISAPSTAFKAYDHINQMVAMHQLLEEQYTQLQSKSASIRNMIELNMSSNHFSSEEVLDAAHWVDQRIDNIEAQFNVRINTDSSQSIEKSIRFLMMLINNSEADAAGDDLSSVEEELNNLLRDFQIEVVNEFSLLAINMDDNLKLEQFKNGVSEFNIDFDLLLTAIESYFKQSPDYQDIVGQLFEEQNQTIEKLKKFTYPGSNHNPIDIDIDIDIDSLISLHKQIQFLSSQFYDYSGDGDQQSDSFISIVGKLNRNWEQYEYLLNQQEIQVSTTIRNKTVVLANELKQRGESLVTLMSLGMFLATVSLIVFFIIAYQKLNSLRITALKVAEDNVLPPLMVNYQSSDLVSTIIKAFNLMIESLHLRDKKIQLYVNELSRHGEQLEEEVKSRTGELSEKNRQLNNEVTLRKENEQQLKLSGLALANTSEAILITDAQSNIIEVNPAFCQLTGYSRTESLGQNPNFVRSGEHTEEFYQALWKSIDIDGKWEGEIVNRNKSGALFPIWETINRVTDNEGNTTNYVGVFRDISKLKDAENELHNLAYFDQLTKLPNRSLFYEHLEHEIAISKRKRNMVAVLFLDLDRFKHVNDTQGHQAGDTLLTKVSIRLKQSVRESDIVARQGGDEFLILLRDINNIDTVANISKNIINELKLPFLLANTKVIIGSSIGISIYPDDSDNLEQLIKNSDMAMYHAKENGKGNYQFFNESMNAINTERQKLEQRLSLAIKNHSFELYFQPQINQEGTISGAEGLLRWQDSELGMISPDTFIPIAEESGTIHLIGQQVIEMACKKAQHWKQNNLMLFPVSINISPKELLKAEFVDKLLNILENYELKPQDIELEITETALLENIDEAKSVLTRLNQSGFLIALDDFGTGYSSLAYLHQLHFDRLKIDRSFINNIPENHNSITLAKTIINLAKSMNMTVVAEGVETQEQQDFLWQNDCDYCQGYGISKPLPEDDFIQLVQQYANAT